MATRLSTWYRAEKRWPITKLVCYSKGAGTKIRRFRGTKSTCEGSKQKGFCPTGSFHPHSRCERSRVCPQRSFLASRNSPLSALQTHVALPQYLWPGSGRPNYRRHKPLGLRSRYIRLQFSCFSPSCRNSHDFCIRPLITQFNVNARVSRCHIEAPNGLDPSFISSHMCKSYSLLNSDITVNKAMSA
jgi:hypothetical protein